MDFIDNFIYPPASREHLLLVKYILIILFSIHFSYMGMLVGNSFYSLVFNILDKKKENNLYRRFSKDLMELVLMSKSLLIIFGILPLFCMIFIYAEILYKSHIMTTVFLLYSSGFVLAGLIFLSIYKITFSSRDENFIFHIISGILSLIFLFCGYLIFTGSTGLLLDHDRWTLIKQPYELVFSLNVIIRYFYFILVSFAISGGTINFFFYYRAGDIKDLTEEYKTLVNKVAVDLTFIFIILQLVVGFLSLITLPAGARTEAVAGPFALILLLSYCIAIALYRNDLRFEVPILLGFLMIFLSMGINDYLNREVAIEEHTKFLISMADKEREKRTGEVVTEPAADGRKIFADICSSCHSYSGEGMTGPPMSRVLLKYKNNEEKLKNFIRNPVKVDQNYGSMPNPGLKTEEINAVADYLLKDYLKENQK